MTNIFQCYSLAKDFFPISTKSCYRKRLEYALRLFTRYPHLVNQLEPFIAENHIRRYIFSLPGIHKLIYRQQIHPCFYRNSTSEHRLHFMKSHFLFMERSHKEEIIRKMYSSTIDPIVFHYDDVKLSFRLNYHLDMSREGLLWLLIEMDDKILYKITFWFMEYNGLPTLCIGALQGGKITLNDNRMFTKKFMGLRPQNMALNVLRWYAISLGIKQLYTFPKNSLWCENINEKTAIEEFWQEQGATLVENTPFIQLHLDALYKDLSEIATRKRSMYKRRYDFLNRLRDVLQGQFELYAKPYSSRIGNVDQDINNLTYAEKEFTYL